MHPAFSIVGGAVFAAVSAYLVLNNAYFAHNACDRLETALQRSLVGQEIASSRMTENICRHLSKNVSHTPLVLSLHGPPGVGKTTAHEIAARALYGLDGASDSYALATMRWMHSAKRRSQQWVPFVKQAGSAVERVVGNPLLCPGSGCPAYKVVFGIDYIGLDRDQQHHSLRQAILTHARRYSDSLIVIEEYDKLHCESRAMLRQIFRHPIAANVTMGKAVVILESNHGMFSIQDMLLDGVSRESMSPDVAHQRLKDEMYTFFTQDGCERNLETAKFLNVVDEFIAFFHLDRSQIKRIIEKKLADSQSMVSKGKVKWTPRLVHHFLDRVVFDGAFAVDGGLDAEKAYNLAYEALRKLELDEAAQDCNNEDLTHLLDVESNRVVIWTTCLTPSLS